MYYAILICIYLDKLTLMNRQLLFILFTFFTFNAFSQEICNNGIDDDNDGLIDLNDSDCSCSTATAVPSLIPNPSFEDIDYCPNDISQLDAASIWIQATIPTTDYFNTCGYVNNAGLLPFPDGNAAVGTFFNNGWQEYLGACLLSPMLAGTNYQIKFNIASKPATGLVYLGNGGVINYGPVDITLYGATNCNSMPVNTTGCPHDANPNWVVLGTANYTPVGTWGVLTISFTPTANINAIILGSPCNLPPDYHTYSDANGDFFAPYFYFDNLILNKTTFFNQVSVTTTGGFCTNNVVLNSAILNPNNPPNYTYQWYLNGVAIAGAIGPSYSITNYNASNSYVIGVVDGANCFVSNAIGLSAIVPAKPIVVTPVNYCQNDSTHPLAAIGSNLLWYSTPTGGSGSIAVPTPSSATTGTFTYYVSQTCGLESLREKIVVIVKPVINPNFPTINPLCFGTVPPNLNGIAPNGISGIWTPAQINPNQDGTYVFHPIVTDCSFDQTLNVDVIEPLDYSVEGGCDNGNYFLTAVSHGEALNINTMTFQWSDDAGNTIGNNQPSIDITAIIDATENEAVFPLNYTLTITDENGCSTPKSKRIEKIFCKIPKGISPNGDSDNEFFDLRGLNVKRLEIFNRYGVKVYTKDNYTVEWKGQTDTGKELPDATYYYYLEFETGQPKTGWVYLIH